MEPSSDQDKGVSRPAPFKPVVERSPYAMVRLSLIGVGVLTLAGSLGALSEYVINPYRKLPAFPVATFIQDPKTLVGSKFRVDLRIEADQGPEEGVGKRMLVSIEGMPKPIALIIPSNVAKDISFAQGQTYIAEVEIREGGILFAILLQEIRENPLF